MLRPLLALVCLSWALPAHADLVDTTLAQVDSDLARGNDARAERRLGQALARKPGASALLLRSAELTMPCEGARPTKQRATELLRRLARAAALPSDASTVPDAEAERKLALYAAHAEALAGDPQRALALLQGAAQRQDVLSAACARSVAALAVSNDQLELATDALSIAREALPQDQALRAELAHLWLARGRTDRAVPLFAERFAIASGDLQARRELAYALAADGRADEALSLLRAAREPCQLDRACALIAARIAVESGQHEEALAYLRARLTHEARDIDALFALADVSTRARRYDDARAAYRQILELRPESVRASEGLRALEQAR